MQFNKKTRSPVLSFLDQQSHPDAPVCPFSFLEVLVAKRKSFVFLMVKIAKKGSF
jgi:hypothetical protein